MENFVLRIPVKLIFGPGEVAKAGEEAAKLGRKALLVTGKSSAEKSGLLARVGGYLNSAGVEYVHFNEIEPNPRSTTIDKAAQIVRDQGCDFVLGLGGGSVMDGSKAIATMAKSDHPVWEYVYNEDPSQKREITDALPIMLIPTLAATASEGNRGGVITNWETNQKAPLFSDYMYPKVSIVDPELTVTVGRQTTIDGAMDIMSHVLESYFTGPENTPLQDRFAEGIIRTVMENLEIVLEKPDDIAARSNLSWCSTMALLGPVNLGRPGAFPLHFIEHVISGHYDIAHGRGLAILLPGLMRSTYWQRPEKYIALLKNVFFEEPKDMSEAEKAVIFIEKFEAWMQKVGMYCKLSDVGINDDKFELMAEDCIKIYGGGKDYIGAYKPIAKDDIVKMLKMVWK